MNLPIGSQELHFWQGALVNNAELLLEGIRDLRSQVANISKREESWELIFRNQEMEAEDFYNLKLAVTGLGQNLALLSDEDEETKWLFYLISENLLKVSSRFSKSKLFTFFDFTLGAIPYQEEYTKPLRLLPVREWLGNVKRSLLSILKRFFRIRSSTPFKKPKRKAFRRGYDDKGSMSSVSQRSRRSANEQEFPYLTEEFREYLLGLNDPIAYLRRLGFLPESRE